jgi:DNA polymerase-3 subunit epsilon
MELGVIIDTYDNIIKMDDGVNISQESINIHNITNEMSQNKGVNIYDALISLYNNIKSVDVLVAHNITFDCNMISVECNRIIDYYITNNKSVPLQIMKLNTLFSNTNHKINHYCTMKNSINMCHIETINKKTNKKYFKYPKLSELHYNLFNNTPLNLHNSFNDVLVCLRCYYKMIKGDDICNVNKNINNYMSNNGII